MRLELMQQDLVCCALSINKRGMANARSARDDLHRLVVACSEAATILSAVCAVDHDFTAPDLHCFSMFLCADLLIDNTGKRHLSPLLFVKL